MPPMGKQIPLSRSLLELMLETYSVGYHERPRGFFLTHPWHGYGSFVFLIYIFALPSTLRFRAAIFVVLLRRQLVAVVLHSFIVNLDR